MTEFLQGMKFLNCSTMKLSYCYYNRLRQVVLLFNLYYNGINGLKYYE